MAADSKNTSVFSRWKGFWRDELWVWVYGAIILWLAESFMIYLRAQLIVVNSKYFVGHPVLETYMRVLPADVLARSLIIDMTCAVLYAFIAVLCVRFSRLVLKIDPDPLAFHGALCLGAILFLYGAVLINVQFLPGFFDGRSVIFTLVWGLVCLLVAIPAYGHIRRASKTGPGRFVPGAILVLLCAFLFPAQMLIDHWMGKSWADPKISAVRAGAFAAGLVIYFIVLALARKLKAGEGKISAATRWAGRISAVGLAVFVVAVWGSENISLRNLDVSKAGPDAPNIILISMDTVRADALSCYNPELKTTPFIDSVAAEGVLFEQARSPSPWTLPGHASIFTGKYPSVHGATWEYTYLESKHATMAEIFRAAGYDTAGFSSNIWIDPFTNMDRGFRTFWRSHPGKALNPRHRSKQLWESIWPPLSMYVGIREWRRVPTPKKLRQSVRINRRAQKWFIKERQTDKPFFLFVNYLDAHSLYNPPKRFKPRIPRRVGIRRIGRINKNPFRFIARELEMRPIELEVLRSLYHGEISFEDHIIDRLHKFLDRLDLWEDTVVVITSDHGEYLGEQHLLDHMFGVGEPVLHVPLIIRAPGRLPSGVRVDIPVQTIDILPTLLELAGIKYKSDDIEGRSLLRALEGKKIRRYSIGELMVPIWPLKGLKARTSGKAVPGFNVRRHTITDGQYQYELDSKGNGTLWLLRGRDGDDVTEKEPDRAKTMRKELLKWLAEHPYSVADVGEGPKITPEIMKEIKALGYVD